MPRRQPLTPWRLCASSLLALTLALPGAATAATYTADALIEPVTAPGVCAPDPDPAPCTLREAVIAANGDPAEDLVLMAPGTHRLGIGGADPGADLFPASGDIDITAPAVIRPASDNAVVVLDANSGAVQDRAFDVHAPASVAIRDITIRNGFRPTGGGGAILVHPTGGTGATLRLERVTVTGSTAGANLGVPEQSGGAILVNTRGTLDLVSSTISGNSATGIGGGISVGALTTVRIAGSTITANTADVDAAIPGALTAGNGGGIFAQLGTSVTLRESIVAGNTDGSGGPAGNPDCAAGSLVFQTESANLFGTGSGCPTSAGGLSTANPLLAGLADNGGRTPTHALLAGSPAIDAGAAGGCAEVGGSPLLTSDQRGLPRNGRCDVGAFEAQPAPPSPAPGPGAAPPAPPAPPPPPPPAPAFDVPVTGAVAQVRRTGAITVRLSCPRTARRSRCAGTVRLTAPALKRRARGSAARRTIVLASARYSIARGRTAIVTLRPGRAARRQIAARAPLKATIAVTPDGKGAPTRRRTLTLVKPTL